MITVYSKPGCPACVGTMRYLERHCLEYRTVDIAQDSEARDFVVSLGYTSMPVVVAGEQHWAGLRIDKLVELAASTSGIDNDVIEG